MSTELYDVSHVRSPGYWRHSPCVWFTHVVPIFHNNRVRPDESRVNYVLALVDEDGIRTVSDILGVDASYDIM